MTSQIKAIEELSLNAWPSHQIQMYDGWMLRFSNFYTHRTNSVEQIGISSLPLEEKIAYCEKVYHRWDTPSVFKITPLSDAVLDKQLDEQGYHIEHTTDVMVLDLSHWKKTEISPSVCVHTNNYISSMWIEALFQLKGTTNKTHRKIVPSMYAAIPKDVISAYILYEDRLVATGLGILDREYIGVYAIHVEEGFRHRGYAQAIVKTLLKEGVKAGATKAYLQVVADNEPAKQLYQKMGFQKLYSYWFRVKKITTPT